MGAFIAGLAAGIGKGIHQRNLLNLQQEIAQKQALAGVADRLASDPNAPEEVANAMRQFQMGILTSKPTEKFSKFSQQWGDLTAQIGMAQQKKRQEAEDQAAEEQAMASMRMAATPIPGMPGVSQQDMIPPAQQAQLSQTNLRFPQIPAPPQFRIPTEELMKRDLNAKKAMYEAQANAQAGAQERVAIGKEARHDKRIAALPGVDERERAYLSVGMQPPTLRAPTEIPIPPEMATKLGIPEKVDPRLLGAATTIYGQDNKATSVRMQAINVKLTDGKTVAASYDPESGSVFATDGTPISPDRVAEFRPRQGGEPLYPVMMGGVPTYVPRTQAAGKPAVRTLYSMEGMPTTGGVEGTSTTAPPVVSANIQNEFTDRRDTLQLFNDVSELFDDPKYQKMGPLIGRIKLAEVDKLGGLGASPEEIKLAVTLSTLLTNQAFAKGGKQLTPTEQKRFELNTPALTDTIQQAIGKTRVAIDILNRSYENRVKALPLRQREQLGKDLLEPPKNWRKRATDAKVGDIVDTPRGRVKKLGPNQFEPVQ